MNPLTLITQAIIFITGIFCLFIAFQLGKRQTSPGDDRLAWSAFRVWWFFLGLNIALSVFNVLFAFSGPVNLIFHIALSLISALTLCVALWGLLYYLVYLFTGNRNWAWPLGVFYGSVFVTLAAYLLLVLRPIGVTIQNGTTALQYASNAPELNILIIALFILIPQILAALAYFSLFFRLKDKGQKYRVLLVSLSILIWFSSPFIALAVGVSELPWWSIASRLLGLIAVLVIYWAYYPPAFIQRQFDIATI